MKILVVFLTQHISKAFKCYLDPKMGLPCPHPVNAGLTDSAQRDIITGSQVTSSLATNQRNVTTQNALYIHEERQFLIGQGPGSELDNNNNNNNTHTHTHTDPRAQMHKMLLLFAIHL